MVSNSSFIISPFSPELREAYRAMLHESWMETYASELGTEVAKAMTTGLAKDDLAGLVPGRDEQAMIALEGSEVCGSAISAARQNITYLWGFYVLRRFQRQGIGRGLLVKAASAHNRENIVEISVLKSSKGAIKFYDDMGFKTIRKDSIEVIPGHTVPSLIMTMPAFALA